MMMMMNCCRRGNSTLYCDGLEHSFSQYHPSIEFIQTYRDSRTQWLLLDDEVLHNRRGAWAWAAVGVKRAEMRNANLLPTRKKIGEIHNMMKPRYGTNQESITYQLPAPLIQCNSPF